jgi:hypothetical protein
MMHRIKLASFLALLIALLGVLYMPSEAAAECTAATMQSTYGVHGNGYGGPGANDALKVSSFYPSAVVGEVSFTATSGTRGTLSGSENLSFGGLQFRLTFTGTYRVNSPGCTGTIAGTFPDGSTFPLHFVIVKGGEEIDFLQTDPGSVFQGVMTKESNDD